MIINIFVDVSLNQWNDINIDLLSVLNEPKIIICIKTKHLRIKRHFSPSLLGNVVKRRSVGQILSKLPSFVSADENSV